MYVCVCQAVSDHDIRRAVARGARTFEDVQTCTGCTTCCGCCEGCARDLVAQCSASRPVAALHDAGRSDLAARVAA